MPSPDSSPSLAANPVLGHWIRIRPDGIVEVRSGKVELGQGVLTALAQIAAEELGVNVTRVQMIAAATDLSPDEGFTAGSRSIQDSGTALRQVCAEARAIYLEVAAAKLAVAPDDLDVADGDIKRPDDPDDVATSYWELADDALLDRVATGDATPRPESDYRVVGTDVARLDLPDKLTGRPRYLHDLTLDGQVYGRVVRPPSRGARLRDVDTGPTRALPGVLAVVRDGDFLAVAAEREEVAVRAADRLRRDASWDERPTLPDEDDLPGYLMAAAADTSELASHEAFRPDLRRLRPIPLGPLPPAVSGARLDRSVGRGGARARRRAPRGLVAQPGRPPAAARTGRGAWPGGRSGGGAPRRGRRLLRAQRRR